MAIRTAEMRARGGPSEKVERQQAKLSWIVNTGIPVLTEGELPNPGG